MTRTPGGHDIMAETGLFIYFKCRILLTSDHPSSSITHLRQLCKVIITGWHGIHRTIKIVVSNIECPRVGRQLHWHYLTEFSEGGSGRIGRCHRKHDVVLVIHISELHGLPRKLMRTFTDNPLALNVPMLTLSLMTISPLKDIQPGPSPCGKISVQ